MSKHIALPTCIRSLAFTLVAFAGTLPSSGQTPGCVPPTNQKLTLYRAGSLTAAFKPLLATFTCQTGIQVTDVPGASVDKARQCTAGGQSCDLYASADYSNIDLFLKPAGYADFTILFAQGRMVLAYSASNLAQKNLPPITATESGAFNPPTSIPKASANWYKILTSPSVAIGSGVPFLDPGAYRSYLIFQLAQQYYNSPMLYDELMQHLVIPGGDRSAPALGRLYDFQFTYEHSARAMARKDPDFRYVDLPDEINLSHPVQDAYYAKNSVVVLPGLGTVRSAQSIPVPGTHVAWGITILANAPNRENAVKFLQLLLGPTGAAALKENGPTPISPAKVSSEDFRKIPESLRPLVQTTATN
jgi:molybdate/tungstate transport system substrate-binding protein